MSQPIWHLKPGSKSDKTFYGIEALETGLIGIGWGHQIFEKISKLSAIQSPQSTLDDLKECFSDNWYVRSQLQGFIFGIQPGHTIVMYDGGSPIWAGTITKTNSVSITERKRLNSPNDHFVHRVEWEPSIGNTSHADAIQTLKSNNFEGITKLKKEVLSFLESRNIQPITNIQRTLQWAYEGETPTCSEPELPISLPLNWEYFDSVKHQSMIVNNSLYDAVYELCIHAPESCNISPIIREQDFLNLFSKGKTKWIVKKPREDFAKTTYCIKLGSRLTMQEKRVLFDQIRQQLKHHDVPDIYLLNDTIESNESAFTKYAIDAEITLTHSVVVICFHYEPQVFKQHTPIATPVQVSDNKESNNQMTNESSSASPQQKALLKKIKLSKNLILEGVPGTGKTFAFKNTIVKHWNTNVWNKDTYVERECQDEAITMHPSTSYEDFLEGLRPKISSKNNYVVDIPIGTDDLYRLVEIKNDHYIVESTNTNTKTSIPISLIEEYVTALENDDSLENMTQIALRTYMTDTFGSIWARYMHGSGSVIERLVAYHRSHPTEKIHTIKICSHDSDPNTKWFTEPPKDVQGNFSVQDGFFLNVCKQAVQNPSKDYLVLLDEINRCNIPSVFGDLLTTIERSKRATWDNKRQCWDRSKAEPITLAISKRKFFVPENVYVVGTMNTTDRSVAPMDMALRRRFAFHRIEPTAPLKENFTEKNNFPKIGTYWDNLHKSIQAIKALNTYLENWGKDALLGYSYIYDLAADLERYGNHQNQLIEHHWNHHILPQLGDIIFSNQIVEQKLENLLGQVTEKVHEFTIVNRSTNTEQGFDRPSLELFFSPE